MLEDSLRAIGEEILSRQTSDVQVNARVVEEETPPVLAPLQASLQLPPSSPSPPSPPPSPAITHSPTLSINDDGLKIRSPNDHSNSTRGGISNNSSTSSSSSDSDSVDDTRFGDEYFDTGTSVFSINMSY